MNTALALNPILREPVGFDRLNDLFESNLRDNSTSAFPHYDIVKHGDDNYVISLAVPGFAEDQLQVVVQRDQLEITGRVASGSKGKPIYLHQGIRATSFERTFRLAEYMRVTGAEYTDGILHVHLLCDIPDDAKPQTIQIQNLDRGGKTDLRSVGQNKD